MSNPTNRKPHILFLFSDTGGGHRSAAEAITEALNLEFPGKITTEMVDIFRNYAPPPFDIAPDIYPPLSKLPEVWGFGYRLSNRQGESSFYTGMYGSFFRRASRRLVKEHPSDLIVSVHPLMNAPFRRAVADMRIPFITVVTDMVSTHSLWYDPNVNFLIVPTESARQRGIRLGVHPEKIEVIGLPVADRFCHPEGDRNEIRNRLGWSSDLPVVLLVGGGEGMGPIQKNAEAINKAKLPIQLVIIAGRNEKLKSDLEKMNKQIPIQIYGFVREMPEFMLGADILITKAGPGTISEAFIAGLPMILYSRMPGQEDGNVTYVVEEGAGVWAPEPELVVNTLRSWLEHPELRCKSIEACKRLAQPDSSHRIAKILASYVGEAITV